jgi:hypothetical protein
MITKKFKIYYKNWRLKNKKYLKIQKKKYYLKYRNKILEQAKRYYCKYRKNILLRRKNNKKYKEYQKQYMKLYGTLLHQNWTNKNRKKLKIYSRKYCKNKYKNNLNFKMASLLRTRIRLALKGNPKISTTLKLLGCSLYFLKNHLEKKFKPGMNWSNHGKWHIDHIRPCASFDLSKPSEQRKCFNYANLQPLWAKDNLQKSKRRPEWNTKE